MGGAAALGVGLAGCGGRLPPLAPPAPEFGLWPAAGSDPLWPALSRLGYGPRPSERARAAQIGLGAYIEEQLAPERLDDGAAAWRVRRFETLTLDPGTLYDAHTANVRRELQQATLLRAVLSPRQLYEALVEFWGDHFNISQDKGDCDRLKTVDDRRVIRPHALGRFRDLLGASAHSPAMLVYLDNVANHRERPNENYARELLELHTLGIGGGYTQRDIQQVSRVLTGWTVQERWRRGQFEFARDRHDDGPKTVLGLPLPAGGGVRDGEQLLDHLAEHPSTARFLARKLARRFLADDPPPALVEQTAATFQRSGGDIRATLRSLLLNGLVAADGNAAAPLASKLKRPFYLVASALRLLDAETDGGSPLLDALAGMGQPLFQWPSPDGFPDQSEPWLGGLLPRWQFAQALAHDALPGTKLDVPRLLERSGARTLPEAADRFAALLLGGPLPEPQRAKLLAALDDRFDERRVRALLATLLASAAFQGR